MHSPSTEGLADCCVMCNNAVVVTSGMAKPTWSQRSALAGATRTVTAKQSWRGLATWE